MGSTVNVGATVPDSILPIVARLNGLSGASRSGLVRMALALFQGKSQLEATEFLGNGAALKEGNKVTAQVPADLADVGDANRAWAIRVGLGMAAGMTRKQAEDWARMDKGPAVGTKYKPRKSKSE